MNFKIGMTDGVSAPAKAAGSSLSALDAQIKSEGASLRALEGQMRSLQKAGAVDIGTYKTLAGAIEQKRGKVAGLTEQLVKAGGAGYQAAKGVKESGNAADGASDSVEKLAKKYLGWAAAMYVAKSAVSALADGFALMVKASEDKGDATRSLELLYGSQEAAEHTYKVIEGITSRVAISQGRAIELTDAFTKAGQVNGDQLVKSIEAVGKAEAARKGAGQVIEGIISRTTSTRAFSVSRAELMQVGLSYRDLAKEISKQTGKGLADTEIMLRTGGVRAKAGLDALSAVIDTRMGKLADQKFMTVGVQTQRLRDNFDRLFEGADTGPLAKGLKVIADLLDESSVSGAGLRTFLKAVFDDISKAIDTVGPYVALFFDGMVLMALKVYNALYPVRQAIAKLFGGDQKAGLESFESGLINFANNIAKGFAVAAVALAWIIDKVSVVEKALDKVEAKSPALGVGIQAALNPMGLLFRDWGGGKDAANDNARAKGKATADGVAAGIREGTPTVDAAMAALGDSALKSFDAKMQIHSPSRVMAKRGEQINEGTAQGIERSSGKVGSAMSGVGSGIPGAMGSGGGRSGGGVQVIFQEGAIVIHGASEGQMSELKARLGDMMADVFQQAALMSGEGQAA